MVITMKPGSPAHVPLREQKCGDTLLTINARADRRLEFRLYRFTVGTVIWLRSPPLTLSDVSDIPAVVEWDWTNSTARFRLFDSIWFEARTNYHLPFEVPARTQPSPAIEIVTDCKTEIAARWELSRRLIKSPYSTTALTDLRDELAQLKDLISLILTRIHHIRGAITIVRKLIADKPPSLIQFIAGQREMPLRVYSSNGPPPEEFRLPESIYSAFAFITPSTFVLEPAWGWRFETDLDQWLTEQCNIVAGKTLSNRQMIKSVADKIGAHVDLTSRPSVEALLLGSNTKSPRKTDLVAYVLQLATSTLALGETLLDND